jgi:hypothetical protein
LGFPSGTVKGLLELFSPALLYDLHAPTPLAKVSHLARSPVS